MSKLGQDKEANQPMATALAKNEEYKEKGGNRESSIYQKFKMNSHKIMLENTSLNQIKCNERLSFIKKRIGRNQNGRKSVDPKKHPDDASSGMADLQKQSENSKMSQAKNVMLPTQQNSIVEIEQRILKKMKNKNKTDRNAGVNRSAVNKHIWASEGRNLVSPGSDKAESSFPSLTDKFQVSARSSPYGKRTAGNNIRIKNGKKEISQAMARIKKSVLKNRPNRNSILGEEGSNIVISLKNDAPYNNEPEDKINLSYSYSESLKDPKVYNSKKREIPIVRKNLSKLFENCKVPKFSNKRYEIDTADTETSLGYKGMKKILGNGSNSSASLIAHNEYLDNSGKKSNLHQRLAKGRNLSVNKSMSIGKSKDISSLGTSTNSTSNIILPKIKNNSVLGRSLFK
ncbi:unnamed protein product [Moneuplotes crassus]|uniref:Uncharacterized protein n=1 Tax=Euplotes crassus TaxID=5936 RepID=A0AAD1UHD8_EUPCR|nr:unnamed protein product [Moneuplotes crassus]